MSDKLPADDQLIKQLLNQDSSAFQQVMDAWYGSMYYVASSITSDAIADEVIQETWISVLKSLPKFEGRSSLKSWVMRILANEAKTRRRKESRNVSLEQIEDSWSTDPRFDSVGHWQTTTSSWHADSPDQLMQADELKNCIQKHIDLLPEKQKAALMLRETESYELDEICNILEVTSSNVRVLLHRARDKVLQVIDRFEREGKC
ncbi:RNA polymerase sigma factor [Pleionea sediminis]|uniref:RNA polymerase sigma factor n=1 Tax=Pleionea sediminis TaxID=2569479 RepID=UPI001FE8B2B3|nr:RNA polymerase sigma factor [Pleionea sediminis]